MENAQNKPVQPRNIFEVINQNVVDMSQDNVAMFELVKGIDAKIDRLSERIEMIYAALYPAAPQEIPEGSPNDPGEEVGFENE